MWSVSATLHDLYTDVSLDVLAPVNQPGTLRIESISVGNVGELFISLISYQQMGKGHCSPKPMIGTVNIELRTTLDLKQ